MLKKTNINVFKSKVLVWLTRYRSLSFLMIAILHTGTALSAINKPNIILIIADDLGYTDIGAFGSEISTPNLDSLADKGVRLSRFYTSPICSPTRAMLMSGVDNHLSGLGAMAEAIAPNQLSIPGYEGYLNFRVASLPQLLKDQGYNTYISGKWHLGREIDLIPTSRGFDRSFVLLNGGADHFNKMLGTTFADPKAIYIRDGHRLEELPEAFYSSDDYTSHLLEFIDNNREEKNPFFAMLSFTAPHWPVQAPLMSLKKYRGIYDSGWDAIREKRLEDAKQKGVIPEYAELPPRPGWVPAWGQLPEEKRKRYSRLMEAYAAMIDRMDFNIGRVLQYLDRNNLDDNTMIVFFSDNGADGDPLKYVPVVADWLNQFDQAIDNIGKDGSFARIDAEWGHVSETPFHLMKGHMTEGGIRSPAIVVMPEMNQKGSVNPAIITIRDILPSFVELAGGRVPGKRYKGNEIFIPTGKSFIPLLKGKVNHIHNNEAIGMEFLGHRALIKDDWKLVWSQKPYGNAKWELFNVVIDPGEQNDLVNVNTVKFNELFKDWESYVANNNVVIPEGQIMGREQF